MLQLRLTEKVRREAGLKPADLVEPLESDISLGHWTVNIFKEDRRKVLIFVNDITLYSFILYGVRKDNLKNLGDIFLTGLEQLLKVDGFDSKEIESLLLKYSEVQYTKTNSKKVLGNINDLIQLYKIMVYEGGGFKHTDVGEVIHRLNRMPQRNIDWRYSIDAVAKIAANMVKNV